MDTVWLVIDEVGTIVNEEVAPLGDADTRESRSCVFRSLSMEGKSNFSSLTVRWFPPSIDQQSPLSTLLLSFSQSTIWMRTTCSTHFHRRLALHRTERTTLAQLRSGECHPPEPPPGSLLRVISMPGVTTTKTTPIHREKKIPKV